MFHNYPISLQQSVILGGIVGVILSIGWFIILSGPNEYVSVILGALMLSALLYSQFLLLKGSKLTIFGWQRSDPKDESPMKKWNAYIVAMMLPPSVMFVTTIGTGT